jgi:hypothetical protein
MIASVPPADRRKLPEITLLAVFACALTGCSNAISG